MSRVYVEWTQAEDNRLVALRTMGRPWAEVVEALPGRTQDACFARLRLLGVHKMQEQMHMPLPKAPSPPRERKPVPFVPKGWAALAETGSIKLRDAIEEQYRIEARRRGTTPDAARLILNYSPAELQRMMARAA